ncbi:MmgE/PrpD family protein [Achromobacter aloeverae]|uniref:2-methylcitrate dehydratase n=1 Tax=Achromobacter aloeverae TaxID=1750518 RepID=A0A4Q1HJ81_9BURK|nr:MmgE/PrpD family protein [Achromobacter aloeverae]RXN86613.1 2-methylcitrate dehydratase [Achromobacter aloeverae]
MNAITVTNATQQLAEFITAPSPGIPDVVLRRAARQLVDTVAVTLAGARDPIVQALQGALEDRDGGVALPWTPRRFSQDDACLLVGTASHVLDYDDVCMLAISHPSAPILSALQVLARSQAMHGRDFLECYVVGTEVMIRCGEALGFGHYDLGFHATGTLGVLGAAAACARALGLTPTQARHALAIAASQSAGLRVNFGSAVKSMHVGLAAASGLRSARLAQAGLDGAQDALSGKGWLHAMSGGAVALWPQAVRLGQPYAMAQPGFEQKRYPCCYMMHKMIRATLSLRERHGLGLPGLEQATVLMARGGTEPLIHPSPRTGLNAKFSGPYAIAASLEDGQVGLKSFHDAAVMREPIQQALPRVRLVEAGEAAKTGGDVGAAPVTVELRYADGQVYACTVSVSPGSIDDPLSDKDLQEKWLDCVAEGLPEMDTDTARRHFHRGLAIEAEVDVRRWLALEPDTSAPLSDACPTGAR